MTSAFGNEPGPAALDFLNKVRKGEVNLKPGGDTALHAHTSPGKLQVIRKRLETLGRDLREGTLEVGEIRTDDEFAAVMVWKVGGIDSFNQQVFPVALVRRGGGWLPAPVLASFENAVSGYTVPVKKRLGELEEWMLRERVFDLGELMSLSADRIRVEIKKNLIGEDLEGDDLGKIADGFLKACAAGNRAAILGYLGGLTEPLPEDWGQRVRASRTATDDKASSREPWRLLAAPEVVRVRVLEQRDGETGLVSIACLDPARSERSGTLRKIEVIHLGLSRDQAGLWRINLPDTFLGAEAGDQLTEADALDVDLMDKFPEKLREAEPLVAHGTAREAAEAVMEELKPGGLRDLLRLVNLGGRPKEARIACVAAAAVWWSLNEPGTLRLPMELDFKQQGKYAVGAYQWFTPHQAVLFDLRTLHFRETAEGWVWTPGMVSASERANREVLSEWVDEHETEWRVSWRETLLQPSVQLEEVEFGTSVSEDEVRALIARWLDALESRDLEKAMAQTAWFGREGEIPMKALRNLGYDFSSAGRGKGELAGVFRTGSWVAASVVRKGPGGTQRTFYPVVMTGTGPKLLPEIDLLAGDRSRDFLNGASFARLGNFVEQEKLLELRRLFSDFQKRPGEKVRE